jgi:hypothetical protein
VREIRKPPTHCQKCGIQAIAATGYEVIVCDQHGVRFEEGWTWKCATCEHEWVPPGWESEKEGGTKGPS